MYWYWAELIVPIYTRQQDSLCRWPLTEIRKDCNMDSEFLLSPILLELADIKALQNTQLSLLRVLLNGSGIPLDEIDRQTSRWFVEHREQARADAFQSLAETLERIQSSHKWRSFVRMHCTASDSQNKSVIAANSSGNLAKHQCILTSPKLWGLTRKVVWDTRSQLGKTFEQVLK